VTAPDLEALIKAAPKDWVVLPPHAGDALRGDWFSSVWAEGPQTIAYNTPYAELIAAMHAHLPALIARVRELEGMHARLADQTNARIAELAADLEHERGVRCECAFEDDGTTYQQFGDGSGPMRCEVHEAEVKRIAALEAALRGAMTACEGEHGPHPPPACERCAIYRAALGIEGGE